MNAKLTRLSLLEIAVFSLVAAFAFSASASSEEKFSRQIEARLGGKLVVDVEFGEVDVSAGGDDKVIVEASRKIDFEDQEKEKEYLAAVPITIRAEGNTVTVQARSREKHHFRWRHSSMDGQYTIRVPKNFATEIDTGGGSITASELNGDMQTNSGGGDLKFSRLHGAILASTGGGSVKLDECNGATEIKSGGGDIHFRKGEGVLRARTGGGSIEVRNFTGDTDVQTGGGELTLQKIDGRISGETGGGAITTSVAGSGVHEIELESSGGSIDLTLPATAAADIRADASDGRITTDFPLQFSDEDHTHLRGKLNGGGTPVVLRTSGGSISINARSAETAAR